MNSSSEKKTVIPSPNIHFSSKSNEWETPQKTFDELDAEFHFTIDVAATADNAKCATFYTEASDGLAQTWTGTIFCNPPYGREIGKWIEKAALSARDGATVVMLIPARTDTKAWHQWIFPSAEVRFLVGRLKFGSAVNSAPFPSAVVIFRPHLSLQQVRGELCL